MLPVGLGSAVAGALCAYPNQSVLYEVEVKGQHYVFLMDLPAVQVWVSIQVCYLPLVSAVWLFAACLQRALLGLLQGQSV